MRKFLKGSGPEVPAGPRDPRTAQKNLAEHVETQSKFLETDLRPRLDAAMAGHGHVFFVDAAHFVFGTFVCCLWSFAADLRPCGFGSSAIQRLGAWNAVTHELIAVTNTTVVNTETMCELLRKIAAVGLTGPITLVLDNARYQHNAAVKALAETVGDHLVVPAVLLTEPEPDRTLVEVHQTPRTLRPLPSDVRRLSGRHPRDHRRPSDHPR